MLDAQAFPHIIERIIDLAPYESLLGLRGVSSSIRARADARLCSYLLVRSPKSKRTPGVYVYTQSKQEDEGHEPHPVPIPGFAFYPEIADRPYSSTLAEEESSWALDEDVDQQLYRLRWGWSAWGIHSHSRRGGGGPPEPRMDEFQRIVTGEEMARGETWCRAAATGVRVIDLIGDVGGALDDLSPGGLVGGGLRNVRTLRVFPDERGVRVPAVSVPAPHVLVSMSLLDQYSLDAFGVPRTSVPLLGLAVQRLTLLVEYNARYDHPSRSIPAFAIHPGLTEVTFIFQATYDGYYPTQLEPGSRRGDFFGVLSDVFDHIVHYLDRVRLTLVGVNPESAPMLNVFDNDFRLKHQVQMAHPTDDGHVVSWADLEREHWDSISANLKTQLLAGVEKKVRQRRQSETDRETGKQWTEEQMLRALGNVRIMGWEEWMAEEGHKLDIEVAPEL